MEERCKSFQNLFFRIKEEISKTFVGQDELVELLLTALIASGHVLLEGVPGLGKTLLVKTLSKVLNLEFSRIQFTPDLMPADITGSLLLMENEKGKKIFEFQPGPIFANMVLGDEINRASPRTQSALLEAMQEHQVTINGHPYKLKTPFFVLATQNPIEMEGTYPLPEAQLDRFFFKLVIQYPSWSELGDILDQTTQPSSWEPKIVARVEELTEMTVLVRHVLVAESVRNYAIKLLMATHPESPEGHSLAQKYLRFGASPRGAQCMILAGKVKALLAERVNVSIDDVRSVVIPALRHRLLLNFYGEAEGIDADDIIKAIIKDIKP